MTLPGFELEPVLLPVGELDSIFWLAAAAASGLLVVYSEAVVSFNAAARSLLDDETVPCWSVAGLFG